MGEVGFPSARSRVADAGDSGHGDGDQPDPGDAAAVRYASRYSPEFVAALADALHLAKHRAATDTFGFEPGCVTLASPDSGDSTASVPVSESVAAYKSITGATSEPSAAQLAAALATSSRLPSRPAVSPASDMPVSAVNVR